MKVFNLIAITLTAALTFTASFAQAGKLKNMMLDAEFEINDVIEFQLKQTLISTSNYELTDADGSSVQIRAIAIAQNATGQSLQYSCIVPFIKVNEQMLSQSATCTLID